jgi:hypothetical protein
MDKRKKLILALVNVTIPVAVYVQWVLGRLNVQTAIIVWMVCAILLNATFILASRRKPENAVKPSQGKKVSPLIWVGIAISIYFLVQDYILPLLNRP